MKLILITEEITKQFTIKRLWDTFYFLTFFAAATCFLAFVLAFLVTFFINFIPFPFWAIRFDGFLATFLALFFTTFLAPTALLATFFARQWTWCLQPSSSPSWQQLSPPA